MRGIVHLGLSTIFCIGEQFKTALILLTRFNVEHVEIVDEGLHSLNSRRLEALKGAIAAKDMRLSIHAPFTDINIASISPTIRHAVMKRLKKSMMMSARLNPEYWIFHSGRQSAAGGALSKIGWEINLRSVRELLKEARKYGLKIAIENTPDPLPYMLKRVDEFERFYEDLGFDGLNLGITFDVGHANIIGQINEFIESFRDKIVHVHLHDNNGRFDEHLDIGSGNIDWPSVIESLKKINYSGALIIESKNGIEKSIQTLSTLINK